MLVVVVQSNLVVMLMCVHALRMTVIMVMVGRVTRVVIRLGMVSMHVIMGSIHPVVVRVVVGMSVGTARLVVMCVVMVATYRMFFTMMAVVLGVVMDVVMWAWLSLSESVSMAK